MCGLPVKIGVAVSHILYSVGNNSGICIEYKWRARLQYHICINIYSICILFYMKMNQATDQILAKGNDDISIEQLCRDLIFLNIDIL